jgi:hypothetical protein
MKKKLTAIIAIILVVATMTAQSALAIGVLKASDFFDSYSANISKTSTTSTTMKISFEVNATGTMTTLGASSIKIYVRNSSTDAWSLLTTLTSPTTTGLTGSNRSTYSSSANYTGTAGKQYYASVTFYAVNSSGSGSLSHSTNTVTL